VLFRKKTSKPSKEEFLALVDEIEAIVRRKAAARGQLSPEDNERMHAIESRLVSLVSEKVDDRRKAVRLMCNLSVKLHVKGQVWPGTAVDIGAGGVFVVTDARAEHGAPLLVEVNQTWAHFQAGETLPGTVAWLPGPQALRQGLGVAFTNIGHETEAKIRFLVIQLLRTQIHDL
jgi:hypothetical protein